ncbi:MAG: HlyD family efflux transporter periplasmic adaptor subunit [Pseudomonadota bacterium]
MKIPYSFSYLLVLSLLLSLAGCSKLEPDYFPGYVEAEYVRLGAPVAGTLTKLQLKTGDQVHADAPAFLLEQENERAERAEAEFRVQRAQSQLSDLKKGKRPDELAAVQAQLAQAEAALRLSQADLARQSQLVKTNFISAARLDEARAAAANDQAKVNELRADVRVARLGARSDEIVSAERDIKIAEAQLAQSEWKLSQKVQKVPADATVVDIYYREGEQVPAGMAVVSLLPPENIKARFFVPENQLGALQLGQPVSLSCDGCGKPVAATITYVSPSAQYTAPIIYSKENRANLVFMLEARPSRQDAPRLHPGQPLEIRSAGIATQKTP